MITYSSTLRTLGTPDEIIWPGVSQLKEYKSDFPKWKSQTLESILPQLDHDGIDLLKVIDALDNNLELNFSLVSYDCCFVHFLCYQLSNNYLDILFSRKCLRMNQARGFQQEMPFPIHTSETALQSLVKYYLWTIPAIVNGPFSTDI